MNHTDKWVKEASAYGVVGGLASLPVAMSEFPWIYAAMLLPLIVSYIEIRNLIKIGHGFLGTWCYSPGPYLGTACTFHLVHGEWDYQGVAVGLIGWTVLVPIMYAIAKEWSGGTRSAQTDAQQDAPADAKRPRR